MTYAEAIALRDALEASLLSDAGLHSVTIGDKTVTYQTQRAAKDALAMVNRDIKAYERKASNLNPAIARPRWR